MSHFYGTLNGNRGEATRCGSKDSGMTTYCASWSGAVHCQAHYNEKTDEDWVLVELVPWHGHGTNKVLYDGPISGAEDALKRQAS
jgi:hypothetical protein